MNMKLDGDTYGKRCTSKRSETFQCLAVQKHSVQKARLSYRVSPIAKPSTNEASNHCNEERKDGGNSFQRIRMFQKDR